jgi:muramidase (phage lysozyme)
MPVQIPAVGYGLLNAIAGPESGGRYNVLFGGKTFSDYSGHPNIAVPIEQGPNAGKSSSAAGRYQFLGSTWGDIANRYGLPDFSPTSQDQGAWALANENYRKTTGGDLATDLQAGKVQQVAEALSPTWTSLAGGIEAQPGGTGAPLAAAFQAGLPDPAVPVTTPPTPSPGLLSMAPTPEAAAATAATDQASPLKGLLAPSAPVQDEAADPAMGLLARRKFAGVKIAPPARRAFSFT